MAMISPIGPALGKLLWKTSEMPPMAAKYAAVIAPAAMV